MRPISTLSLAITGVLLSCATSAFAGVLTIDGPALYCDSAKEAVAESLKNVSEVNELKTDIDARRIVMNAGSEASAREAVAALAKSGFHGTAKYGDKIIPFPESGVKPGFKRPFVTLVGPYLGCGASVNRLHQAIQQVDSVEVVDIDRNARTVRLSGKDVDVYETVKAINQAGFQVALPAEKVTKDSP